MSRPRWPRPHWPTVGLTLAALALVGALAGAAVVGFGLYNVSAKAGHWPGVSWLLHATFRNSVDLRADGPPPPPEGLDDPGMVALGAGHYDSACATCHAAPGRVRSATVLEMAPQPPHITEAVRSWSDDELHWIVHEGVKMSGMPGWPASRGDDVWPVVAFLQAVDGMSAETYSRLTQRPDGQYCAMCHGTDGRSGNPHIPRLDILSEQYIALSLSAYRKGTRDSGIMEHAITQVPEAAVASLARYFASVPPVGEAVAQGELARRGRALAAAGPGDGETPACRACHGPWPEPLNPLFPSLAGQHAPYLVAQLRLWREGVRGGSVAAGLMHQAAQALEDDDIAALAAYYASLAPATLNRTADLPDE